MLSVCAFGLNYHLAAFLILPIACGDDMAAFIQVLPATVNDVHQYLEPKVSRLPQSAAVHRCALTHRHWMIRASLAPTQHVIVGQQPSELESGCKCSTQPAAEVSSAQPQSNYGLDWGFGAGHQVVTPSAPDREPLSVSHSKIVLMMLGCNIVTKGQTQH